MMKTYLIIAIVSSWMSFTNGFVLRPPVPSQGSVLAATASAPMQERPPISQTPMLNKVKIINSHDDFIEAMASNADRPVVIKFYDKVCRACNAVRPKYERMAQSNPGVTFYKVSFSDNKKLCKSLDIRLLPTIQIYCGAKGKVVDLPVGPSRFHVAEERLLEILNHEENEGKTGFISIPAASDEE